MEWRQGDVFDLAHIWMTDAQNGPVRHDTPLGVVVISQSCDAAQPSRPTVQVAPVVTLTGHMATEAESGKRVGYAHLPHLGADRFADLYTIATIQKSLLVALSRMPGVSGDNQVRRLAGTIARKFGRFAFPDEVIAAIDPMRDALRSKARKEESPLGQALANVYAIRVEAQLPGGWAKPPYHLNLVVVLEPDVLPLEPPHEPSDLRARILGERGSIASASSKIAQALTRATTNEERHWLWAYLAESWAAQCEAAADQAGVRNVVASVSFDLVPVDEMPMSRVDNSEDLDLDYLSEPLPRALRQR